MTDRAHEHHQRVEITKKVALLLGSFINAGNIPDKDRKVYSRMLIEEIIAAESTLEAVESTCRQIRKTATFLPAIGEFMKVLKEQDELWDVRFGGIWHSQSTYEELQFLRDDLEELNRRGVRTGQNGLRDLERNARVWHRKLGPGIVLGPNSDGTVCVNFTAKKSLQSRVPRNACA